MEKISLIQIHSVSDGNPCNKVVLTISSLTRGGSDFYYNALMEFINSSEENKKQYFKEKEGYK